MKFITAFALMLSALAGCSSSNPTDSASQEPAGKLVVSTSKAGGWKGFDGQPYAEGGRYVVPATGTNNLHEVTVVNLTGDLVNGATVHITFDPGVFEVSGVWAPPDDSFHLEYNNRVPGVLRVSTASAYGTRESRFRLFRITYKVLPNAERSSAMHARFVFYNENGMQTGTQNVRWVFRMVR